MGSTARRLGHTACALHVYEFPLLFQSSRLPGPCPCCAPTHFIPLLCRSSLLSSRSRCVSRTYNTAFSVLFTLADKAARENCSSELWLMVRTVRCGAHICGKWKCAGAIAFMCLVATRCCEMPASEAGVESALLTCFACVLHWLVILPKLHKKMTSSVTHEALIIWVMLWICWCSWNVGYWDKHSSPRSDDRYAGVWPTHNTIYA
jgi:hypothetical protein